MRAVHDHLACAGHVPGRGLSARCAAPCFQVVERAQKEDLNKLVNYHVAFIRNSQGRVVTDVRSLAAVVHPKTDIPQS